MEKLYDYAAQSGISLSEEMLRSFGQYERELLSWNEKMNLTAITAHEDILIKHFLDSLMINAKISLPPGARIIDVGTGAGFPSVPLKIYRSDLRLTLLDSLGKRVKFLSALSESLEQDNVCIHGRAEEVGRKSEMREVFDVAAARAVVTLPILAELCLPFVKPGGTFIAMKGYDSDEELKSALPIIKVLGGEAAEVVKYILPSDNKRSLIIIKKISKTPANYPRNMAKILKCYSR